MATLQASPHVRRLQAPKRRIWKNFDIILQAAAAFLVVYGMVMIRSTTQGSPTLSRLPIRQVQFALASAVLMFVVAAIDYRYWQNLSRFLYGIGLVSLVALLLLGLALFGSQRWFNFFGLFFIQPAELAKIGSVIWVV